MPTQIIHSFRWLGKDAPYLDTPTVTTSQNVIIGCYGGNRAAGASKNEDGALVWSAQGKDNNWEFAVLLDAHYSAQSAALVLEWIEAEKDPAEFQKFLQHYIYSSRTFAEYLEKCGGKRRIEELRHEEL